MLLFPATQIYTVHINPSEANAIEKAVFVREGFSIFAFIFSTIWALYNRLWLEFFIIFTVYASMAMADKYDFMEAQTIAVLNLAFSVFMGFQAFDIKRNALARRGYIVSDVVVSDNELRAQQRYFDRAIAA